MPVNSVFYFACLKTESTESYNTLSVKAYFQYTPSNNGRIYN